jgi:PAS domain S-box-containing protein
MARMPNGTQNGSRQSHVRSVSSDALLASIVDSSADAIVSKDLHGIITSWNKAAETMFGYTAEEALGRPITIIIPTERLQEQQEILARIGRGERIDYFETQRKHKDGSLVDVAVTVSPVRDHGGQVIGASKVARNIGEQKRNAELRGLLAAIVDSSDDAIISKDLNSTITSWNIGAQRIFGYKAEEAIGRPIWMLFPPDRIDEERGIVERIKRGERVEHFETLRMRKDGSLVEISLTISPIKDANGRIVGASKIARDISDRKRSERTMQVVRIELEQANRQLKNFTGELERRVREKTRELEESRQDWEAFAYSVSHDARRHLRSILNFTSLLQQQLQHGLCAEEKDYFDRVEQAANRLRLMIEGVLTFTKVMRSELQLQPVSVDEIVADIVENNPDLQAPAAELQVANHLGTVLADPAGLHQCLANLLSNAAKYIPEDTAPRIQVGSEPRGSSLRIWIQDNGIGIPEEEQGNLFQMFQRLNNARNYEGTGLGLAIVKRAAERMGGTVGVQSSPGAGSKFWIELKRPERAG